MHKRTRIFTVVAVGVTVLAVVIGAYAYVFGFGGDGAASAGTLPTFAPQTSAAPTTATTTTTKPAPTTTTLPKQKQPPAMQMPDPGRSMGIGAEGPVVLAYEQRLASLHIDTGPVDGVYDQKTAYAVDTVEKIYGLERDGRIGPQVRLALSVFQWPKPLTANSEPDRVEISLDKQYLVLYAKGQVKLITNVSTGGGYAFCGGDDGCQYAVTPPGRFEFTWFHDGWRTSKLGRLYKPYYFNRGIAIHGYPSVPNHPASHGCVRIPMHVADYFHTLVHEGFPIYVVGTPSHAVGEKPPPPPPTTTTTPPTTVKAPTTTKAKPKPTTTTAPKPPTS